MGARARLDVWLVERGLAPTREKAQALVMAGRVRINGAPALKSGVLVAADAAVEVLPGPTHVGRGALKLEGALDAFGIDPKGRIAVDVGRGQLHDHHPGVTGEAVVDRVNARSLTNLHVPEPCGIATADVSFISVRKVLSPLRAVMAPSADAVVLVKPQFEVGRGQVGRGGIVKDPGLHALALRTAYPDSALSLIHI